MKKESTMKIVLLSLGLIGIVVWLGILTYVVMNNQSVINRVDTRNINSAIAMSEETRYKTVVSDFSSKKAYLYETGLSLPLNAVTKDVRYELIDKDLYISLSGTIGKQRVENKTESPSCEKIIRLAKDKTEVADMIYVDELAKDVNGFKYIYKHTSCTFVSPEDQNTLIEAVKQVSTF